MSLGKSAAVPATGKVVSGRIHLNLYKKSKDENGQMFGLTLIIIAWPVSTSFSITCSCGDVHGYFLWGTSSFLSLY